MTASQTESERAASRASGAEPWRRSASELAAMLAKGEVSARELALAHLARIDAVDGSVHAYTEVLRERALADADAADEARRRGDASRPLLGLPVSVKECFDVEGRATTLGIPSWRTKVATADAAMVRLLREAGCVVLGRTNLSQTMLFVESRNPIYGQTSNPFSRDHSPGGSSGGEAAAVAAGMSPLGVGTDIGGSIRTPAAFCGVAGIKPTLDRLPSRGQKTVLAGQEIVRSQCGPIARRVADLALFFRALDPARMAELDPRVPPIAWSDPGSVELRGLRVGVCTDDGVLAPSRGVVRATERAAEALAARGCELVSFAPPAVVDAIDQYLMALSADGGQTIRAALAGGDVDPVLRPLERLATLPGGVRRALARVASLAGEKRAARMLAAMGEKRVADLWRLTDALRAYRFRVLDAMDAARIDVLVMPPYATPAMPHGMSKNFTLGSSYSMVWNLVQFPAGVVPVGRVRADEARRDDARDAVERHARKIDAASVGLPLAAQLVARPWQEPLVLAAMAAVEAELSGDPELPRTPVDPA